MATVATIVPTGLPAWSRQAAIGDYDGAPDKEDSVTEGIEPYAAGWYRELHAMRGSAYTKSPRTLVDAENIAIARMSAAVWSRTPEKARANQTPLRADEKLEYWLEVLAVQGPADEQRWQMRQRAVTHFRAAKGPTTANVLQALTDLLGDAFVAMHIQTGPDLATPPPITYWPGVNPGVPEYDLGGGAWFSERAQLEVEIIQPPSMSLGDFLLLTNVQLFDLLDKMLPAWAGFTWAISTGGFLLDTSLMDFDGLTP